MLTPGKHKLSTNSLSSDSYYNGQDHRPFFCFLEEKISNLVSEAVFDVVPVSTFIFASVVFNNRNSFFSNLREQFFRGI